MVPGWKRNDILGNWFRSVVCFLEQLDREEVENLIDGVRDKGSEQQRERA